MNSHRAILAILLVLPLIVIGCDTFYNIPLSGSSDTLFVELGCGKMDTYLQVWQGHVFDFYQTFNGNEEVTLYPDSLKVYYKGQRFYCRPPNKKGMPFVSIIGHREVRTAFEIDH
ncbi:MAG TPA: hypothetical protein VIS48_08335 [Candidatus Kryptonia bacterium]